MDEKTRDTLSRAEWVIEAAKSVASKSDGRMARSRVEDVRLHGGGYAEPGYTDPECGVIAVANWNSITRWDRETNQSIEIDATMPRLAKIFDSMGIELEWCDEWTECSSCWKLLRTSPDCYSWSRSFVEIDGERVCLECLDPEEHLAELEGEHQRCNTIHSIEPTEHGYQLVCDEFERGFHRGQDADPGLIGSLMKEAGFERYIFNIEGKGQFDLRFGLYLHDDEAEDGGLEKAKRVIHTGKTDGPSNSEALRRGLMEATRKEDQLRAEIAEREDPPGIFVAKIGDGGVDVKEVSVKDFIDGKALD